jgi:hypothetical protein
VEESLEMHQLIAVLAHARTPTDAVGLARSHYQSIDHAPLTRAFDGFTLATDLEARLDALPSGAADNGAVRAETDDAQAYLDRLWKQTQRAQARHLAIVDAAFDRLDHDQILDNTVIDGVEVDPSQPHATDTSSSTERGSVRDSMRALGSWQHPCYRIYDQYGSAVRSPTQYDQLEETFATDDADEKTWFVVPLDVHY